MYSCPTAVRVLQLVIIIISMCIHPQQKMFSFWDKFSPLDFFLKCEQTENLFVFNGKMCTPAKAY